MDRRMPTGASSLISIFPPPTRELRPKSNF
eukprot:CCRYP_010428-RC/>CCRYP_010428-RC protein AED:0.45 eAED:1.00 QI:0/-1/0/1/-1/0/1/0/29